MSLRTSDCCGREQETDDALAWRMTNQMLASWSACLNDQKKFKNGAPIISFFTTGDTGDTSPAPNAIMHANVFTGSPQTSENKSLNAHVSNDLKTRCRSIPRQNPASPRVIERALLMM